MIHTFKFEPKFSPTGEAMLGTIPAGGRILRSEPIADNGKLLWLIEVDDAPENVEPIEHYRP
jgi:hypothetical protein